MQTSQRNFIDTLIDPIPFVGPLLADLFHTWSGVADAMNLRKLTAVVPPAPPGGAQVVLLDTQPRTAEIRKAA